MTSIGITAPEPLPRYPKPVLTPAGGAEVYSLSLWYIVGPTYSLRFSCVTLTLIFDGSLSGSRGFVVTVVRDSSTDAGESEGRASEAGFVSGCWVSTDSVDLSVGEGVAGSGRADSPRSETILNAALR